MAERFRLDHVQEPLSDDAEILSALEVHIPSTVGELEQATDDANFFATDALSLWDAEKTAHEGASCQEWIVVNDELEEAFLSEGRKGLTEELLNYLKCSDVELRSHRNFIDPILRSASAFAHRLAPLVDRLCALNPAMTRDAVIARLGVGETLDGEDVHGVVIQPKRNTLIGILTILGDRMRLLAIEDGITPIPSEYTAWSFGESSRERLAPKVVIADPFAVDGLTAKYWSHRAEGSSILDASASKTRAVLYDLELLRQAHRDREQGGESKRYPELEHALEVIESWIEQNMVWYQAKSSADIENYTLTMEGAEDFMEILHALDVLKHHDPRFFVALLGVAPRNERSPYFGSFLHKALFNTQRLARKQDDDASAKVLRISLDQLLTIDANVEAWDFANMISKETLHALGQKAGEAMMQAEKNNGNQTVTSVMLGTAFAKRAMEYEVRRQLEAMRALNFEEVKKNLFPKLDDYEHPMLALRAIATLPQVAFHDREIVGRLMEIFGEELYSDTEVFQKKCREESPDVVRRMFHCVLSDEAIPEGNREKQLYESVWWAIQERKGMVASITTLRRKKDDIFLLNIITGVYPMWNFFHGDFSLSAFSSQEARIMNEFFKNFSENFLRISTKMNVRERSLRVAEVFRQYAGVLSSEAVSAGRRDVIDELERNGTHLEMLELFGKYYLGCDEAEKTFTLHNGRKMLEIGRLERKKAMGELEAKLAEPDVAQFVELLKRDEKEKEKWMLVYVPGKGMENGKAISIMSIIETLDADSRAKKPPEHLISERQNTIWDFGRERFSKESMRSGWFFVQKVLLDDIQHSFSDKQDNSLTVEMNRLGLYPGKCRRTPPTLRFFSLIAGFKNTGERLMQNDWDRSDVQLSFIGYVSIGRFGPGGMIIGELMEKAGSDRKISFVR